MRIRIEEDGVLVSDSITTPAGANEDAVRQKAAAALAANAAFLAAAKPSTAAAQASGAYDQAVRLTRETNALIRLLLEQFDDTTGT